MECLECGEEINDKTESCLCLTCASNLREYSGHDVLSFINGGKHYRRRISGQWNLEDFREEDDN